MQPLPVFTSSGRSFILALGFSAALAGAAQAQTPGKPTMVLGDIAMGMADAPVTIVEYSSITCAACQHFHIDVLPRLKARYILNGEARFILRDHPTPPAPVAIAGFAIARCAGPEKYYPVLNDLFARQTELLASARTGGAQQQLLQVGAAFGLSPTQVEACVRDKSVQDYIQKQLDEAPDFATPPAVFVNGERIDGYTYEAIAKAVDAELAALAPPPALAGAAPAPAQLAAPAPTQVSTPVEVIAPLPPPNQIPPTPGVYSPPPRNEPVPSTVQVPEPPIAQATPGPGPQARLETPPAALQGNAP